MPNKEIKETDKELNRLSKDIMSYYDIIPDNISIIQSGTVKTVWKVKSGTKTYCLKRLKQTIDKALFSVNAQIYIKNSGGNVPGVISDLKNQVIVTHNEQLFVLYEWLHGTDLDFSNKGDLFIAIQGLAKFHLKSKGYRSCEGARVSTKLGKWPEQYKSMADKLLAWKEISKEKLTVPCYSSFMNCVDSILDISNLASDRLDKSAYKAMTAEGTDYPVLCHQDFGRGNAILSNDGLYVLDLDGVTFDLPARDLRKIIGKHAENKGRLDVKDLNDIILWYSEINPLSKDEINVLYIDLLYPHWFYGLTKNIFLNSKLLKSNEIEKIAKLEQSKASVLNGLLK